MSAGQGKTVAWYWRSYLEWTIYSGEASVPCSKMCAYLKLGHAWQWWRKLQYDGSVYRFVLTCADSITREGLRRPLFCVLLSKRIEIGCFNLYICPFLQEWEQLHYARAFELCSWQTPVHFKHLLEWLRDKWFKISQQHIQQQTFATRF